MYTTIKNISNSIEVIKNLFSKLLYYSKSPRKLNSEIHAFTSLVVPRFHLNIHLNLI